ncbi:MAG TPA: class B sortase [Clostridia bacterium]|nr:class B sortase [Clostridia bacterium]
MNEQSRKKGKIKRRLLNIFILICFIASGLLLYQAIITKIDENNSIETYSEIEAIYENSIRENPPEVVSQEPVHSDDPTASENPSETSSPEPTIIPTPSPRPTPSPEITPAPSLSPEDKGIPQLDLIDRNEIVPYFNDLLDVNEDIRGYIKIPGTNISYPVVQGLDNEFYLERNIYGEKTISASIFMDYRNNPKDLDDNTIIYGHNLNTTMFNDLDYFVDEKTRDEYLAVGGTFRMDTAFRVMEWEIFAAYVIDKDDFNYLITNFISEADKLAFIERIYELNFVDTGVTATLNDKILTLSTCNHWFNDSRTVIHARLIENN